MVADLQQSPSSLVKLICGCLILCGGGPCRHAREFYVVALQLGRGAKINFQFVQSFSYAPNTGADRGFVSRSLLQNCRRSLIAAGRVVNALDSLSHPAK